MTSWLENNGLGNLSPSDDLWGDAVNFVSSVIGLDKYFLDEQCDVVQVPYKDATANWNNGIRMIILLSLTNNGSTTNSIFMNTLNCQNC